MTANSARTPITLYACPHACSLVAHLALEHVGAQFDVQWIDVFQREQFSPEYLALSPRAKVPLLRSGDLRISENVAILLWLAQQYPDAGLMPATDSADFTAAVSVLAWCSSGIHPAMSRVLVPGRFLPTATCHDELRLSALAVLDQEFALVDRTIAGRQWWFDAPGAVDFYLFWVFARSSESNLDTSRYPHYAAYVQRLLGLGTVQRVLQRERQRMPCFAQLGG